MRIRGVRIERVESIEAIDFDLWAAGYVADVIAAVQSGALALPPVETPDSRNGNQNEPRSDEAA